MAENEGKCAQAAISVRVCKEKCEKEEERSEEWRMKDD